MLNRPSKDKSTFSLQKSRSKFVWFENFRFESLKSEYFNFCVNCRSKSNQLLNGEKQRCVRSLICIMNGLKVTDSVRRPFFIFSRFKFKLFWTRNLSIVWDLWNQTDLVGIFVNLMQIYPLYGGLAHFKPIAILWARGTSDSKS